MHLRLRKLFFRKLYVHFNSHFRPSNIFAHLFVALFLGLTVALAVVYHQEAIANITIITAFEITFIVLLFLTKLIQDVQRVYIFFRHFRNKVYPERSTASISRYVIKISFCSNTFVSLMPNSPFS